MKWLNVKEMKKNEIQAVYSIFSSNPYQHTKKPRGKSCRSTRRQSLKVAHPPYQEQRAQIAVSILSILYGKRRGSSIKKDASSVGEYEQRSDAT